MSVQLQGRNTEEVMPVFLALLDILGCGVNTVAIARMMKISRAVQILNIGLNEIATTLGAEIISSDIAQFCKQLTKVKREGLKIRRKSSKNLVRKSIEFWITTCK